MGGGAAGFFAAINAAYRHAEAKIIILEKSNKLLSKVRVSGGGRCNVTNHCFDKNELIKNYPRGNKELKQVFSRFDVNDTIAWFKERGVELKTEPDERMFPVSDNSETIIDCFMNEARKVGIEINLNEEVLSIESGDQIRIKTSKQNYKADSVICSIGGHNQIKNYGFLQKAGHSITPLIPSLFTINLPESNIKELMGLSVKRATVKVHGTKHSYTGPVLITHWGLSGPAVLKLSAFAAKDFFEMDYKANISVNWSGDLNEEEVKELFREHVNSKTFIVNTPFFEMPKRLWDYLLQKAEISEQKPWNELGKKQQNNLAQVLTNDVYNMQGKTTFKEEFVTSGGVNLKEIDFKTMQSKIVPSLFFCGEVLDIDGITGGFNFQSCWSTGWIAANSIT
jgi:predicted Rossmann fold flavoprotein